MRIRPLPVLYLLIVLVPAASPDVPVYHGEPTVEFMRSWLLCGPFPNPPDPRGLQNTRFLPGFYTDYLAAHGGESGPSIQEGQLEEYEGGSARWFAYTSDDFEIDLDEVISQKDNVLAYAYCEVQSDKKRVCTLAVGSNDGVRVWLNGEEILDLPVGRGLKKDDDLIPVVLRRGRNSLLLKVEESANQWGFCCRFLPYDTETPDSEKHLFKVITDRRGIPWLQCGLPESVMKEIYRRVRLRVVTRRDPKNVVWRTRWVPKRRTRVGVDTERYGEYLLRIKGKSRPGGKFRLEIPFVAGPKIDYVLFADGKTDYVIVVGSNASESERWAAGELQRWLGEISSATFTITDDSSDPSDKEIILGFNRHAQETLGPNTKLYADSDESFTYLNVGPRFVIWGGKQRGTMYGVMTFLERELGCRWYTPRVSVIPSRTEYRFHYLYHKESPGIRVRNDFYFEAFDPIWAARNKINGAMGYREQPGGVECYWAVHTFNRLVPPQEFFDEHPEYFSLIDGKRVKDYTQLCLTNPDVLQIVTERLRKVMRENAEYLIYSVSQNDWRNPCQCDNCQAIARREESESGPVIWFVNQVAKAIEDEFPDRFIGTLAYQYTRKPPKTIRPRHNVVVRLCSIECCFAHDFYSCPRNTSFLEDLRGWAAIAPHLYIWDYVVNFSHYIMPYPNFSVLQRNLQAFRDNKAIGVMEQAAYQSRGGEFAELRAYVIAKLLWNPDCNVQEVIDDFLHGYYGRSGQYIREYLDFLHGRITPNIHIGLGTPPDDVLYSGDFVAQAEAIFNMAERVADNVEILHRVQMARLPVMYLKCVREPQLAVYDGTYDRFCEIVKREGITHYAERGEPHRIQFHTMLEAYR